MPFVGSLVTKDSFHKLAWGAKGMDDGTLPLGLLAGGMSDGAINLWNPQALFMCVFPRAFRVPFVCGTWAHTFFSLHVRWGQERGAAGGAHRDTPRQCARTRVSPEAAKLDGVGLGRCRGARALSVRRRVGKRPS